MNKKLLNTIQKKRPDLLDGKDLETITDEALQALAAVAEEEPDASDKLIGEALQAYGIDKEHVLASRIDVLTGEAVIVTQGGKKVRYSTGQTVEKLGAIAVTGVNPANEKRKVIAGAAKK